MSDPRHATPAAPIARRAGALREALEDKGLLPDGFLDSFEARLEDQFDWRNGAQVVARAWLDPESRRRLLADGTDACAELGFEGLQGEYIVVLEDTPQTHNVIVCTQCSCTAWPVLGLPPDWYKSPEYRARVAREPRPLLREMGLDLPEDVEIRVWDTSAETRFMVLPLRPSGTESWNEQQLAAIVTREAMIGVARIDAPNSRS